MTASRWRRAFDLLAQPSAYSVIAAASIVVSLIVLGAVWVIRYML